MDSKFFTCPINIPHCQRIACYGEPGKNPQHNAMDCFGIPGCCFDSKAYQYKYLLGEQALKVQFIKMDKIVLEMVIYGI